MCDIFHAMDILASTSSIWNLCVISLDRYLAGQDPIGYRDRVSKRRITMAIVLVWVMSACKSLSADYLGRLRRGNNLQKRTKLGAKSRERVHPKN